MTQVWVGLGLCDLSLAGLGILCCGRAIPLCVILWKCISSANVVFVCLPPLSTKSSKEKEEKEKEKGAKDKKDKKDKAPGSTPERSSICAHHSETSTVPGLQ